MLGKNFHRLWFSVGLSNFSDGGVRILLPFLALSLALQPSDAAYVFTFLTLSWPVFGLLAGYVADFTKNEFLPFWCHIIRGLAFAAASYLALMGHFSLPLVYFIALIYGFCDVLFEVSVPRLTHAVTDGDNRVRANTRLAVTHTLTSEFTGPVFGSLLSLYDPVLGFAVLALFYFISSTSMYQVGKSLTRSDEEKDQEHGIAFSLVGFCTACKDAMTFLFDTPILWRLSVVGFGASFSWGTWLSLAPYLLIQEEPSVLTKPQFGFLMALLAMGAVTAAFTFERITLKKDQFSLLLFHSGFLILLMVVTSTRSLPLVAIGLFLFGVGATIWSSIVITMRQEIVPRNLLGRVNAAFRVITYAGFPVGSFCSGTLANHIDTSTVFLVSGGLSASFMIYLGLSEDIG